MDTSEQTPDSIDIFVLARRARRTLGRMWELKAMYAKASALAVFLGLLMVAMTPYEYTSSVRLVPYGSSEGGLGQVAGLAGLAGITLPMSAQGSALSTELYPEIANSNIFRERLILREIQFQDGRYSFYASVDSALPTRWQSRVMGVTIGLPFRIKKALRDRASGTAKFEDADAFGLHLMTPRMADAIEESRERVAIQMNKKTNLISIETRMRDRIAAADLAQVTAELLTDAIVEAAAKGASEEVIFLSEQQLLSRRSLDSVQAMLASFQTRNRELGSAGSILALQRLEFEYRLASELYQDVSARLESARLRRRQNTPVFSVIEPSVVPHRRSSPSTLRTVLLALLLSWLFVTARWSRTLLTET